MSRPQLVTDLIDGRANAAPQLLDCWWTPGGPDACWVHLSGALTIATAGQLQATLDEPQLQARLVVLDLRELQLVDTSGVQIIVDASVRARRVGRRMVLVRAPADVDRVFSLAGCSPQLEIGDLGPAEPPVQVLLQLATQESRR